MKARMEIPKEIKQDLNEVGVPKGEEEVIVRDVMSIIEYYEGDDYQSLCEDSVEGTLSEYEEYSEYEIDWRDVYHIVDCQIVTEEMRKEWR